MNSSLTFKNADEKALHKLFHEPIESWNQKHPPLGRVKFKKEWEIVYKDDAEITVYSQEYTEIETGKQIVEYALFLALDTSAEVLFDVLHDVKYRRGWDPYVRDMQLMDNQGSVGVIYARMRYPFPLSDQDYLYERSLKYLLYENRKHYVADSQSTFGLNIPSRKSVVRIQDYKSQCAIRAVGTSSCEMRMIYQEEFRKIRTSMTFYNIVLKMNVKSMAEKMKAACRNYYSSYLKYLDDDGTQSIPSQVAHRWKKRESSMSREEKYPTLAHASHAKPTKVSHQVEKHALHEMNSKSNATNDASSDKSISYPRAIIPKHLASQKRVASNGRDILVEFHKQELGVKFEIHPITKLIQVHSWQSDSEITAIRGITKGMILNSINNQAIIVLSNSNDDDVGDFDQVNAWSTSIPSLEALCTHLQKLPRPLILGFVKNARKVKQRMKRMERMKEQSKRDEMEEKEIRIHLRSLSECQNMINHLEPRKKNGLGGCLKTCVEIDAKQAILPSGKTITLQEGLLLGYVGNQNVFRTPFTDIVELLLHQVHAGEDTGEIGGKELALVRRDSILLVFLKPEFAPSFSVKRMMKMMSWSSREGISSSSKSLASLATQGTEINAASMLDSQDSMSLQDGKEETKCLLSYQDVIISSTNLSWAVDHIDRLILEERLISAGSMIHKLNEYIRDISEHVDDKLDATARAIYDQLRTPACQARYAFIHKRYCEGVNAIRDFAEEKTSELDQASEWKFAQEYFGVSTYYKPDVNNGTIWVKLDGLCSDTNVFHALAVLRETDLFQQWAPFCNRSWLLKALGRVDILTYFNIAIPFMQRDAVMRAYGIDATYEHKCVVLLGESYCEEEEEEGGREGGDKEEELKGVNIPPIQGFNADRMIIKGFRALIEPLSPTSARTCIVANFDPKCPLPQSLINFSIKKLAGILLYLLMKEADKIGKDEGKRRNAYIERMQEDPTGFYQWIRPRIMAFFTALENNALPTELPLPPKALVEGEALHSLGNHRTLSLKSNNPSNMAISTMEEKEGPFNHKAMLSPRLLSKGSTQPLLNTPPLYEAYVYEVALWPFLLSSLYSLVYVSHEEEKSWAILFLMKLSITLVIWFHGTGSLVMHSVALDPTTSMHSIRLRNTLYMSCLCLVTSLLLYAWIHSWHAQALTEPERWRIARYFVATWSFFVAMLASIAQVWYRPIAFY